MAGEKVKVTESQAGKRLDVLLCELYPDFSRSAIQKLVKEDQVKVNEETERNNYNVKIGDEIKLVLPKAKELDLRPVKMDLEICFQDKDVAVINKPKGLIVHPAATAGDSTLVHGLLAEVKDLSGINGVLRPGIVHRIDKDTSGLIIIAKNDVAHRFLAKQLVDKTIKRSYIALVHGVIEHDSGTIEAPIGRDTKDRKKMAVTAKNSKDAITDFRVIKRFKKYTLIECDLKTGRTHQIRVHMQYIGYPIVGDEKYGLRKTLKTDGQMLHAYKLCFVLPSSRQEKTIEVALPEQFEELLRQIEKEENDGSQTQ